MTTPAPYTLTRIPVDDLRHLAEDASITYHWSDHPRDYDNDGETGWTYWEAGICPACQHPTDGNGQCTTEDCDNGGEHLDHSHGLTLDGPVTSAYWPFDDHAIADPVEDARKIADLPLCIVKVDDTYGLALTGGGMDLSWEIAEAFTRLGMYPPLDVCSLPAMGNDPDSPRTRYIIDACRTTLTHTISRLQSTLAMVDDLPTRLRH